MEMKEKKRIEQQLIAQANRIMEEESDVEIIANTLSACQALLRIIDKTVSTTISPQDFEDILAGYIGLTARIKYFYQTNNDYVIESDKKLISRGYDKKGRLHLTGKFGGKVEQLIEEWSENVHVE